MIGLHTYLKAQRLNQNKNQGGVSMHLKSFKQKDRYGNEMAIEFYDVPPMQTPEYDHPGEPKGPDTVPAWLTPGEYVVNAEAVRMFEPEIEAMNEAGREIQRAQGGTIPEYKAEGGGIMQGITDFFTMPKAPPGIEYRRMPDGSIGQFTKKTGTGGGQTYLGKLEGSKPNRSSRGDTWDFSSLYNAEGGPIYAQEGTSVPSWLTDDLLDSLKMVESGGDVNATSEAGAMGAYQIMPSTAAKPGMGVAPLAIEDIRDPNKSRQFAKDYLSAIARENPDFTQEEVITAYHSGAGNVRKAKEGTEALGERGQAYAGKVMDGVEEVSFLDKAGNVLSELNPFGVKEASAQSALVPASNQKEPPKPDEEGNWYDFFFETYDDKIARRAEEMAELEKTNPELHAKILQKEARAEAHKIEKQRPPIRTGLGEEQQEKGLLDKAANQAEQESADLKVLQATSNLEKIQIQKKITEAEEAYQRKQENLKKVIDAGATPSEAMIADTEAAEAKISKLKAEEKDLTETSAQAEAEWNSRNADRMDRAREAAGVPKPESIPEYEIDTVDTTSAKAAEAAAAASQVESQTGSPDDEEDVEGEGKKVPKTKLDEVKSWFTGAFKDLFDGEELARMAILYAGSRALGYDHGGSLKYSMGQYLNRIDQAAKDKKAAEVKLEERRFDLAKSNLDNYTAASAQRFMETLDPNDLVPKSGGPTIVSEEGFAYLRGYGEVTKVKLSDKSEAVLINGKPIRLDNPTIAGLVEPYNKEMQGRFVVADRFAKNIEKEIGVVNQGVDEKQQVKLNPSSIGTQAAGLIDKVLIQNGVSIRDAYQTEIAMQAAIADFVQANADFKAGRTKVKPYSLEQYFNKQVITPLTGIGQGAIGDTTPQNLGKLDSIVRKGMDDKFRGKNGYRVPGYQEEYYNEWQAIYQAWSALGPDGRAAQLGKTPKGWSPFTYWASKTPASEIEKLIK
ncbi:transglycosylase SLT domain-containing protein [Planctomycetota bacterium]|nr:transglycosylase SLT domain-containing protein [Planctomycetota bacterium]